MRKKFLGIVCLLYSIIIIYVWINGYLGNFIAPNMQIYIKSSSIPLIIIGIVLLFSNKSKSNFKVSDLILLIPVIFILVAGDGNLSIDVAKVKAPVKNKNRIEEKETNNNKEEIKDINIKDTDIKDFYFDIQDYNYSYIADYIIYTSGAKKFVGKTIKAKGFAVDFSEYFPDEYFSVGRYTITCCAADAEFTGFLVKKPDFKIEYGKWYEFEGYLEIGKDNDGFDIMIVNPTRVKQIKKGKLNQYVYSCDTYGQSSCKELLKYDFEY